MIDISIIIVSFNARADLERCLASLHAAPIAAPTEIVVVDNASTDGSPDQARRWPAVRVIETGTNLGFAKAINIGIRATTGAGLLLLNSDTVVPPGAVDGLLAVLRRHPDAAIVGPRLVDAAGRPELSFGHMISPLNEFKQKRLMAALARHDPAAERQVEAMAGREHWPDWVSGACLLVWRQDAEAAGLLDERFLLYTEDVDFCATVRSLGRRVLFSPAVEVVHTRGRSVAAAPATALKAYRQSHLAFYRKHHPRLVPWLRIYLWLGGR